MRGFLAGAKLPHPCSRPLPASMQATEPKKRTLKQVSAMDGVYAAFAWSKKAAQLKFIG